MKHVLLCLIYYMKKKKIASPILDTVCPQGIPLKNYFQTVIILCFSRACVSHFTFHAMEIICVVQNFESLICGISENFQSCLGDVISPDIMYVTLADK